MTDAAEQRMRSSVSSSDGSVGTGIDVCLACPSETVEKIEKQIIVKGSVGIYSGGVNSKGRPHGEGSFVREGLTYVGVWKDGERVGEGGYYTNGRLVGNVVWD
mmetsp:Transcript_31532/g.75321  ORF Transcript_31532/g.75321 Transcript_31532/m.75321 type:complete len:103 (-) Transcript_31532:288-596(-)